MMLDKIKHLMKYMVAVILSVVVRGVNAVIKSEAKYKFFKNGSETNSRRSLKGKAVHWRCSERLD